MSKWISVKDRLPEEMTFKGDGIGVAHHVLVFDGSTMFFGMSKSPMIVALFIAKISDIEHFDLGERKLNPTHWMPLPEKP